MKKLSAALAVASLLAVPAVGHAAEKAREPVSISASTDGLDLNNPNDIERLRTRMKRAIAEACNPSDRVNPNNSTDWQCRRELAANINSKVQMIAQQGSAARIATN